MIESGAAVEEKAPENTIGKKRIKTKRKYIMQERELKRKKRNKDNRFDYESNLFF